MTRNERQLKATEQKMADLSSEIESIWKKSEEEGRDASPDETQDVESKLKEIRTCKARKVELEEQVKVENEIRELGKGMEPDEPDRVTHQLVPPEPKQRKSMGQTFVESEGYKSFTAAGGVHGQFTMPGVELDSAPWEQKAGTLFEGGQGAGLFPVPQVIPGVVEKLFERLTIADLLPTGQASGSSLRYVVEGTATNAAAQVDEGAAKPASDLALSTVDEPIRKLATFLTTSDEMLEDATATQSYINSRLGLFVQQTEEAQLLSGTGGNNIIGLLNRSGVNTLGRGTVDNNAVALFKAINGTRGSAFLDVDGIVMHPTNWQATRLMTDTAGQFLGGGPFFPQYGNSGMAPGQYGSDNLWGIPVVVTSAIAANTALVGSFRQGAQVWRRSGVSIDATNAHNDYFQKNLVAIRAEERLGLAVYRPAAFTKVTGLS